MKNAKRTIPNLTKDDQSKSEDSMDRARQGRGVGKGRERQGGGKAR